MENGGGMDQRENESAEELGGMEGEETVVRKYCMREQSIFGRRKERRVGELHKEYQ